MVTPSSSSQYSFATAERLVGKYDIATILMLQYGKRVCPHYSRKRENAGATGAARFLDFPKDLARVIHNAGAGLLRLKHPIQKNCPC